MTAAQGRRLLDFAKLWFDADTVARVFEPLIADHQREWHDNSHSRRWWLSARNLLVFARAFVACSPRILLAPLAPSMARRVLSRVLITTSLFAGLLLTPWAADFGRQLEPADAARLMFWLLPACVFLALPFAMMAAADAIRRDTQPTWLERAMAMRLAIATAVIVFVGVGWITPIANHQFRVESRAIVERGPAPPARGARELSTSELLAGRTAPGERPPGAATVRRELNQRAALTVLPILLLWLRWRALDLPRGRWSSPLPLKVATVAIIVVFFGMSWSQQFIEIGMGLRPGVTAWLPLAAFGAWGLAEQKWRRRSMRQEA